MGEQRRVNDVRCIKEFTAVELLGAVRLLEGGLSAISFDEGDPFRYDVYESLDSLREFFKEEIKKDYSKSWAVETVQKKED